MKTEVWLAFVFGVVFLLISLCFALIAFYLPKPENPEVVGNFLFVMQVVLAISASGVAAVIPGFLNVSIQKKFGKSVFLGIRAGGAIAVFVLVFVISPKSLTLDQLNRRVGFNERLEKCRSYIPVDGNVPLSGALQYCVDARDFDPSRWESYRQLARLYLWYSQYLKSIQNYKKAISLMMGKDYDKITAPALAPKEFATEFAVMNYGIAMAYVGLANAEGDASKKEEMFQESLAAVRKSQWFATSAASPEDQLEDELVYLEALDDAYIWLNVDVNGTQKDKFDVAVNTFKKFLNIQGAIPQWAEYHLSCLYNEAAKRFRDGSDIFRSEARGYLIKALNDLLRSQSVKSIIQDKLMACRLLDPQRCERPRGSEPMICESLAELIKSDAELQSLISRL